MNKAKQFLKNYKRPLLHLLSIVITLATFSCLMLLLLMAFDIISINDGIHFNEELFHSFRTSWYGWIIFILIMSVLSVLLFVVPGMSMAFTLLTQALYPVAWEAFLLSLVRLMLCSALLYMLGHFGGYKICSKILGEEDCKKALGLLRNKGTVYFPVMMMLPIFPDDALVMIAGTLKMSLKWFIPSIIIGRGIGAAAVIFGLATVPFDKFTTIWHWIGFLLVCVIGIFSLFFISHKLNKYMDKKRKNKKSIYADEEEIEKMDSSETIENI